MVPWALPIVLQVTVVVRAMIPCSLLATISSMSPSTSVMVRVVTTICGVVILLIKLSSLITMAGRLTVVKQIVVMHVPSSVQVRLSVLSQHLPLLSMARLPLLSRLVRGIAAKMERICRSSQTKQISSLIPSPLRKVLGRIALQPLRPMALCRLPSLPPCASSLMKCLSLPSRLTVSAMCSA